jgi:hypothetical protein
VLVGLLDVVSVAQGLEVAHGVVWYASGVADLVDVVDLESVGAAALDAGVAVALEDLFADALPGSS